VAEAAFWSSVSRQTNEQLATGQPKITTRAARQRVLLLTLAPFSSAYLIVGMAASMRCVLVMRVPSSGTLKSTRAICGQRVRRWGGRGRRDRGVTRGPAPNWRCPSSLSSQSMAQDNFRAPSFR
jgi:hypothetical protein